MGHHLHGERSGADAALHRGCDLLHNPTLVHDVPQEKAKRWLSHHEFLPSRLRAPTHPRTSQNHGPNHHPTSVFDRVNAPLNGRSGR